MKVIKEYFFMLFMLQKVTESVILTKTKASQVIYFPKKNNSAAQNILEKCLFISSLPPAQQVLEFMNNCCHDVLHYMCTDLAAFNKAGLTKC